MWRSASGAKRFEREDEEGRRCIMQCAYGSVRCAVPLPAAVQAEAARASYRNGVLRVELAKREARARQAFAIPVDERGAACAALRPPRNRHCAP